MQFDLNVKKTNSFLRSVFLNMIIGILISISVSLFIYFKASYDVVHILAKSFRFLFIIQLILVFSLNNAINKLNPFSARFIFYLYSALNGINLTFIGLSYDYGTIVHAFLMGLVIFVVTAIFGFLTNEDLSSYRKFLLIGLISLIIMSIINIFLKVSTLYWIETIVGIVIFSGLTAYDVNRIKHIAYNFSEGDEVVLKKIGIIGALQLYLDFINLFIYALSIFGRRK